MPGKATVNRGQISDPFGRLLAALEPWLDQMVIVGGWAHRLYRLHPDSQALDYPPLSTLDADVALSPTLMTGETGIHVRLLAFGFEEEFFGETRPPATHYHLGGEASGFYAEFLTPLAGSEYDRKKERKAVMEVAGASTQQLRHIELLLNRPWSIHVEHAEYSGRIRIANPVGFLAQKILIHRKRERQDRAKDILYMRDTLEVFGARLPDLADLWRSDVAGNLQARHSNMVTRASREMFAEVSDDIRRAAEISTERALDPEDVRQACYYGFTEVFGA
jgi:hypothetical protein